MPSTAAEIRRRIGANQCACDWDSTLKFGILPKSLKVIGGDPLFPRLELEKELDALESLKEQPEKHPQPATAKPENIPKTKVEGVAQISIDDFAKVELRVAKVTVCEKVEKSDKLLKLTLSVGNESRSVVSGIAKWYSRDDLVGKKVILVYNLKPAKLRGVESQGMILAADMPDGAAKVIFVDDMIEDGSKLR